MVQFTGGAVKEKEPGSSSRSGNKSVLGTISNTAASPGDLVVAKDENKIRTFEDCEYTH